MSDNISAAKAARIAARAERYQEKLDARFLRQIRAAEKKAQKVAAYIIMQPGANARDCYAGRVVITFPSGDGAGKVWAVAWMPHPSDHELPAKAFRHVGWASGGGYDKKAAAMAGAQFVALDGTLQRLRDDGIGWDRQLEAAGYFVAQAC
jgi:hypothetical protein